RSASRHLVADRIRLAAAGGGPGMAHRLTGFEQFHTQGRLPPGRNRKLHLRSWLRHGLSALIYLPYISRNVGRDVGRALAGCVIVRTPDAGRNPARQIRINMKTRIDLVLMLSLALTLIGVTLTMAEQAGAGRNVPPPRPKGPCDIYTAAGDPCVAAHSTTRAL